MLATMWGLGAAKLVKDREKGRGEESKWGLDNCFLFFC